MKSIKIIFGDWAHSFSILTSQISFKISLTFDFGRVTGIIPSFESENGIEKG